MMISPGSQSGSRLETTNKHFTLDDEWYCLGCGELVDFREAYIGNDETGFYCSKKCLEEHNGYPHN